MTQPNMIDYISDMDGDELRRNLRDAYGMTTAMSREMDMLHRVRVKQQADLSEAARLLRNVRKAASVTHVIMQYDDIDAFLADYDAD